MQKKYEKKYDWDYGKYSYSKGDYGKVKDSYDKAGCDKNCYDKSYKEKDKYSYQPKEKEYEYKDSYEKCIKVPEVIGRNSCQELLECVIPFPDEYPAIAIKDIQKEIKDLHVHVCYNKVLINGKLHKNINYKTFEGVEPFHCCCDKLEAVYGNVRHVSINIPFNCFIEVPGARPGDEYQIEFAGVEDGCEVDILECPIPIPECYATVYKKLREKVIVKVDLKVLRHVQITVDCNKKNICP